MPRGGVSDTVVSRAGASLPFGEQRRREGRGARSRARCSTSRKRGPLSAAKSQPLPSPPQPASGRGSVCCLRLRDATPGTSIWDTSPASMGAAEQDKARPAQVSEQNAGQAVRHAGTRTPGTQLSHGDTAPSCCRAPIAPACLPGGPTRARRHARQRGGGARAYIVQVGSRCHRRNTVAQIWGNTCPLARAPPA